MKFPLTLKLAILGAAVFLSGCVSAPEIVKTADNHYSLTRVDRGGSFDDLASTRKAMIADADKFAASQGKVAVGLGMKDTALAVQGYTSVEYQFEVLSKSESDAMAAESKAKASDASVAPGAAVVKGNELNRSGAVYDALVKLDDLHKRGILTDDEFTSQKKKILNGN